MPTRQNAQDEPGGDVLLGTSPVWHAMGHLDPVAYPGGEALRVGNIAVFGEHIFDLLSFNAAAIETRP